MSSVLSPPLRRDTRTTLCFRQLSYDQKMSKDIPPSAQQHKHIPAKHAMQPPPLLDCCAGCWLNEDY